MHQHPKPSHTPSQDYGATDFLDLGSALSSPSAPGPAHASESSGDSSWLLSGDAPANEPGSWGPGAALPQAAPPLEGPGWLMGPDEPPSAPRRAAQQPAGPAPAAPGAPAAPVGGRNHPAKTLDATYCEPESPSQAIGRSLHGALLPAAGVLLLTIGALGAWKLSSGSAGPKGGPEPIEFKGTRVVQDVLVRPRTQGAIARDDAGGGEAPHESAPRETARSTSRPLPATVRTPAATEGEAEGELAEPFELSDGGPTPRVAQALPPAAAAPPVVSQTPESASTSGEPGAGGAPVELAAPVASDVESSAPGEVAPAVASLEAPSSEATPAEPRGGATGQSVTPSASALLPPADSLALRGARTASVVPPAAWVLPVVLSGWASELRRQDRPLPESGPVASWSALHGVPFSPLGSGAPDPTGGSPDASGFVPVEGTPTRSSDGDQIAAFLGDESIADESIADESIADESIADEPIADESIAVEPVAVEPVAVEPPRASDPVDPIDSWLAGDEWVPFTSEHLLPREDPQTAQGTPLGRETVATVEPFPGEVTARAWPLAAPGTGSEPELASDEPSSPPAASPPLGEQPGSESADATLQELEALVALADQALESPATPPGPQALVPCEPSSTPDEEVAAELEQVAEALAAPAPELDPLARSEVQDVAPLGEADGDSAGEPSAVAWPELPAATPDAPAEEPSPGESNPEESSPEQPAVAAVPTVEVDEEILAAGEVSTPSATAGALQQPTVAPAPTDGAGRPKSSLLASGDPFGLYARFLATGRVPAEASPETLPGNAGPQVGGETAAEVDLSELVPDRTGLRRVADEDRWQSQEVPTHLYHAPTRVFTPLVGDVRLEMVDGEILEGQLHSVGQGRMWIDSRAGRMQIQTERVKNVGRLGTSGRVAQDDPEKRDYSNLPHVRVQTAGGVFIGRELARDGDHITLMTDEGFRMTLEAKSIEPANQRRTVIGGVQPR